MMHKNSFFWEKASRKRTKARFNLLLLEYGEYFVDDVGVFQYPNPDDGSGRDFFQCDALKVQGRLKLCTRSFIFEPSDGRKALVKFPFKFMPAGVREFALSASQKNQCTIDSSGFFSFACSTVYEMKEDGNTGPYKQVDCMDPKEPTEYFFAVSHSNIGVLLTKISQLRQIYATNERGGEVTRLLAELTNYPPTAAFDTSKLIDFHEKLCMDMAIGVKKIKPLVMNPGYLMMTDQRLYFQPGQLNNVGETTQHFDLCGISRLYKRRYLLMDTAMELIMNDGESVLFCFDSTSSRDYIYDSLNAEPHLRDSRVTLNDMTLKWQRREISNFDYLMFVNNEAGRSLSDLAQYPVYPHVIKDYSSKSLDLENPETFRDLSKPVGALNPQRLEFFKDRMQSMPPEDSELGIPPQFLYGTHYSTPGYVLYYLVRVAPEHMLCLQSGKFDSTDRMFISLADTWDSCLNNPADLKELIPEFFCGKSGEFLVNILDLDLGRRQTGEKLHDVELPPWAKSPKDFIKKHTKALECDYVSDHLHEWIDLIFGVFQRGEMAIEHDNLFYHLTYEGAVDMETITDPRQRRALEVQIQEFGQTPRQVFFTRHPHRGQASAPTADAVSATSGLDVKTAASPVPSFKNKGLEKLVYSPSIVPLNPVVVVEDRPSIMVEEQTNVTENALEVSGGSSGLNTALSVDIAATEPATIDDPSEEIIELGQDFQEEVERALSQSDKDGTPFIATLGRGATGTSIDSATSATKRDNTGRLGLVKADSDRRAPQPSSYFSHWVGAKIGSLWGAAVGTSAGANSEQNIPQRAPSGDKIGANQAETVATAVGGTNFQIDSKKEVRRNVSSEVGDPNKICMLTTTTGGRRADAVIIHSSDPFQAHSEPISGLSLSADNKTMTSSSKDSTMKVLRISYLENAGPSSQEWIQLSVRRSFTASDPPLSGCLILAPPSVGGVPTGEAAKFVLVSSWDSSIYSYSIPNACGIGSKIAHDDGISALGCDKKMQKIVSGSWDASVKVWKLAQSTGLLSSVPEVEFFDHDTPVQCVAMDDAGQLVAAGAEDGRLCIWAVGNGGLLVTQRQISAAGKGVSGLLWIPHGSGSLLIACSSDGNIVCIDAANSTFSLAASGQLEPGLRCVAYDPLGKAGSAGGLTIFAGFSDGSLRLISMFDGIFTEVERHKAVHPGGVNALCVSENGDLLISGGEDGSVRVWEIKSSTRPA